MESTSDLYGRTAYEWAITWPTPLVVDETAVRIECSAGRSKRCPLNTRMREAEREAKRANEAFGRAMVMAVRYARRRRPENVAALVRFALAEWREYVQESEVR